LQKSDIDTPDVREALDLLDPHGRSKDTLQRDLSLVAGAASKANHENLEDGTAKRWIKAGKAMRVPNIWTLSRPRVRVD